MAEQYSPRHFFRKVPNHLLIQYFEAKGAQLAVEWGTLEGKKGVEALFDAFTALPDEELQSAIDVDFHNINALASDGGIRALVNEALFEENGDFVEGISKVDGLHAKAMWAFLHQPDYWRAASSLLHAENVTQGNWRKLTGLPDVPPHVEEKDTDQLAKQISSYFFNKEAKGRRCKVEVYRHVESGKEYFFAYPEDYGQLGVEWVKDQLKPRAMHPAFEIIFVYSQTEHFLDIYAPKNYNAVEELRVIFAHCILKLNTLPDGTIDKQTYDLSPFTEPSFDFKFDPQQSGIKDIVVTSLRLSLKHGRGKRITLQADTGKNSTAVYDLLEELKPPPYRITQVILKVIYEKELGRRAHTKPIRITYPNNCNLNHDGKDGELRKILAASGIEPRLSLDDGKA